MVLIKLSVTTKIISGGGGGGSSLANTLGDLCIYYVALFFCMCF